MIPNLSGREAVQHIPGIVKPSPISMAQSPAVEAGNIILFGPPGTGKSTIGQALALKLDRPFLDTDTCITEVTGLSIPDFFRQKGEAAFRELEASICRKVSAQTGTIISCGGGALLNEKSRQVLEASGVVILLQCDTEELIARLQGTARPLLGEDPAKSLPALLEKRASHYASFAFQYDVSGGQVKNIVSDLIQKLNDQAPFTCTVKQSPDSRLAAGRFVLRNLKKLLAEAELKPPFIVVSDSNVAPLYGRQIADKLEAPLICFPAGEHSKTFSTMRFLFDRFYDHRLERSGTILAVGGGVVGDLTGFAAATYLRGVPWVMIATSLLSMVDASIGGKVAVNLPQGKNMAGTFYPPALILSDPACLDTLPDVEFHCGMAELIKTAVVGDPLLFEWLASHETPSETWIQHAVLVKKRIVEEDPYDLGRRASLNLGHTVGHALERNTNFFLRHGEAVAVGLLTEARIAEDMGLCQPGLSDRLETILRAYHLPTRAVGISPSAIREAMNSDKKRVNHTPTFALPVQPGEIKTGCVVPEDLLLKHLTTMQEEQ